MISNSVFGLRGIRMKKAFVLIIICVVLGSFLIWKKSKTTITIVLPEKSVFFIDQDLSSDFKKNIETSIQAAYSFSKNPQEVMNQATSEFVEISSMKVQICQSDKICFYVDAADPIFLLNNEFVVCGNGVKSLKNHFALEIVQNLVQVTCLSDTDLKIMVDFTVALPEKFKQEFLIEWIDQDNIVLQPKDGKDCILQVSAQAVPSLSDLQSCQKIVQTVPIKSKTKKKRMVYDVRFKNQIIVR